VYGSLTCALPSPVAPVYAVGSAVNVRRRARAAEWGSLLMSCRPQRRPEVQILSPPPMLTRRPYNLMTCARSSTDRASDYGSEGWGFESLRARNRFVVFRFRKADSVLYPTDRHACGHCPGV